ncbi:MAG: hypothetical protein IJ388_01245 [Oscillospiraceae bacterium]|nr:hypothetical protein [Oscillospiraceae bacterium]
MTKKSKTSILAAIGLLVLILDTRTSLSGASVGLELCIRTVIPSLLPFFVLSILLTSALAGENIPILRPLGRLCGIPRGAESLLLVGMLGGYPAGAQCVAQAYQNRTLTKHDAQRMIAFCNLAGPAFLFGIVSGKFSNPYIAWALWGIHIGSAILVAMVLPRISADTATLRSEKQLTLSTALQRSLRIMASVCGWIILFRIIIAFLDRWVLWLLPIPIQVTITGILELSNGCCDLGRISSEGLRFIISAGMLAFGGLCVYMQTADVTNGLSLKTYVLGKLLQILFSVVMASFLQFALFLQSERAQISMPFFLVIALGITITVKFLRKKEKRSSFSQLVGV